VLTNLLPTRQTIALDLTEPEITTATNLFADRQYETISPKSQRIWLNAFGYRWLRLGGIY
jgi:hypothetical protein